MARVVVLSLLILSTFSASPAFSDVILDTSTHVTYPGDGYSAISSLRDVYFVMDDFSISSGNWNITSVTAYGLDTLSHVNDSGFNPPVNLAIYTYNSSAGYVNVLNATGEYQRAGTVPGSDQYGNVNLVFNIGAVLGPGTYWARCYVDLSVNDDIPGDWAWYLSNVGSAASTYLIGTGVDYLGPSTDAFDFRPADLSFKVEGDPVTAPVPEPATMLLLGSGLAGLAGIGRKRFRK